MPPPPYFYPPLPPHYWNSSYSSLLCPPLQNPAQINVPQELSLEKKLMRIEKATKAAN